MSPSQRSTPRLNVHPRTLQFGKRGCLGAGVLLAALCLVPTLADAAPVWTGDFETGDLSQFGFVLNGEYASAQSREVAEGDWAGRIELHNDAAWSNGLKRVELQHSPAEGRTSEGASTFFAWSVMAPEELSTDPSQQIGYWESNNSFQQMMAFAVAGEQISFATRRPQNVIQWDAPNTFTTGEWHRIAMQVVWSTDPQVGRVNVWFDGEQVVTDAAAQTLADNNPHFVQFGLLRGAIEFEDIPTIFVDNALEGDSLEDVAYDALPGQGGGESSSGAVDETSGGPTETTGGPEGTTGGVEPTGANTTGGGASDTGPQPEPGTGTGTGTGTETETDAAGADDDEGGCSVGGRPRSAAWLGGLLLAGVFATRRRKRVASARPA